MKRTTISLPDDLAAALEREARRCRVSISQVAREAIEARLRRAPAGKHRLPFIALGASGYHTTSEDIEEILAAEWTIDRDR
jgi:predicted transcriptional regulator